MCQLRSGAPLPSQLVCSLFGLSTINKLQGRTRATELQKDETTVFSQSSVFLASVARRFPYSSCTDAKNRARNSSNSHKILRKSLHVY